MFRKGHIRGGSLFINGQLSFCKQWPWSGKTVSAVVGAVAGKFLREGIEVVDVESVALIFSVDALPLSFQIIDCQRRMHIMHISYTHTYT